MTDPQPGGDAFGMLHKLLEVSTILLNPQLDFGTIMDQITRFAVALSGAEFGAYFYNATIQTPEADRWVLGALHGAEKDQFSALGGPRITKLFKPTFEGHHVVRYDDVTIDPDYGSAAPLNGMSRGMPKGHLPVRSYLAAPILKRGGGVQGALLLGHRKVACFGPLVEQVIGNLSANAAIAFDNAENFRRTQESEQRFRDLIEFAPRIKWTCDAQGKPEYFNAAWREYAGERATFATAIHPDDLGAAVRLHRAGLAAGEAYDFESRFRAISGEYKWHSCRVSPIRRDGEIYAWVGGATNIHSIKEAERARIDSETRMRIAHNIMQASISEIDAQGIVLSLNAGGEALSGLTAVEVVGKKSFVDPDFCPPEYRERELSEFKRLVRGESQSYTIERSVPRVHGGSLWINATTTAVRDERGAFRYAIRVTRDVSGRVRHEERQKLLLNELNHRVKNTLATVQSIAQQTAKFTPDPAEFNERFQSRLFGISATHNLLTDSQWEGAWVDEIVKAELMPFHGEDATRWVVGGPRVLMNSNATVSFGMVVHELATNAVKYGALSNNEGHVDVLWYTTGQGERAVFHMRWIETDGPQVTPPSNSGFGSRMIQGVERQLSASIKTDYKPGGVECRMAMPLQKLGEVV